METWIDKYCAEYSLDDIVEENDIEAERVVRILYNMGLIAVPPWLEDYHEETTQEGEEE